MPSKLSEQFVVFLISGYITDYLFPPKLRIVFRPYKVAAARMPVPEASVYKNHRFIFGKNDVRFPWKPSIVFPIAEPFGKEILSDKLFGLGILVPDTGHIIASSFGRMYIRHNNPSVSISHHNSLLAFDDIFL